MPLPNQVPLPGGMTYDRNTGDVTYYNGESAGNVNSGQSASAANKDYGSYWDDGNIFSDFFGHSDTFAHNEALAAWERESDYNAKEAQAQREYEAYMSNTAFQRKVADYAKAGFSPLAALEGSVGASTPSGSAASASGKAASNSSNPLGSIITAVIMMMATIAGKGISAATSTANASAKAAANTSDALAKIGSAEKIAQAKIEAYRDVHSASWAKKVADEVKDKVLENPNMSKRELEYWTKIARTRWVRE